LQIIILIINILNSLTPQDTSNHVLKNSDSAIFSTNTLESSIKHENARWSDTSVYSDTTVLSKVPELAEKSARPSIFSSHSIVIEDGKPLNNHLVNQDWITVHLLISISLIAWVQIFFNKRLKQIFKSFIGVRFSNQLSRGGNIFRERISIPLLIVYLISISLFIYLSLTNILNISIQDFSGLKLFSVIILFVLVSWFIKNITISVIGNVFKNYLILTDYILTNFIFNIISGLILIPVLIIALYLPSLEALYSGVLLWGLMFFYRLLRELFTTLSYTNFSLFNRILYLCTLEIIPLIVLTKLVMRFLI